MLMAFQLIHLPEELKLRKAVFTVDSSKSTLIEIAESKGTSGIDKAISFNRHQC